MPDFKIIPEIAKPLSITIAKITNWELMDFLIMVSEPSLIEIGMRTEWAGGA
jgi:hypothetical protein